MVFIIRDLVSTDNSSVGSWYLLSQILRHVQSIQGRGDDEQPSEEDLGYCSLELTTKFSEHLLRSLSTRSSAITS